MSVVIPRRTCTLAMMKAIWMAWRAAGGNATERRRDCRNKRAALAYVTYACESRSEEGWTRRMGVKAYEHAMVELHSDWVLEHVTPEEIRLVCFPGIALVEQLLSGWVNFLAHIWPFIVYQSGVKTGNKGT